MNLARLRQRTDRLLSDYNHMVRVIKDEKSNYATTRKTLHNLDASQKILQEVAQYVQQSAHKKIASVVSKCLQTIFGKDAYEFKIDFIQSRGRTDARLLFVRNDEAVDPKFGAAGGVLDVASFALRLACVRIGQPQRRMVLFLDEPFKHLSKKYRKHIPKMLSTLSKDLKTQFVIVTHMEELVEYADVDLS